jgi:microcystin-dependent protein
MSEPFIGQIMLFAGNFAPRGWAFCNGQLLSIAQNTALFAILGTTYGGNGQTTFALPDLRGRVPVGPGQGPSLPNYNLGEQGGANSVTLTTAQMPAHTHAASAATGSGTSATPANNVWAGSSQRDAIYASTPGTTMHPAAISAVGNSQPHENMQPYTAINYIIALEGIFPSRN